jgi:hypothetical protein
VGAIDILLGTSHTYRTTKFWVISVLISALSVVLLPNTVLELQASVTPEDSLLGVIFLITQIFGVFVLPFSLWQHVQQARFFRWLRENSSRLEEGVTHPDGYKIDLDTRLVTYTAVFSVLLATISFESRPYVYDHRSAGAAQIIFTLLSAIFGWWYLGGLDGIVNTAKALHANIGNKHTFTIRELSVQKSEALVSV